ncbi:MAG: histidine--tRNA ligase [Armatimonadota bacterium]
MQYSAPRGTKDIMPRETPLWRWLEATFRHVCWLHSYSEIRTPIFEDTEVFTRSAGESSDIVTKQMYTFRDRGDNSLTLRPEGTAGVVRAYLEHGLAATSPVARLFYIGPVFRYERPQAGRYRQHHQVGVECFGIADPTADAEVISLASAYLSHLGITGTTLYVNSIGCKACRPAYRSALLKALSNVATDLCGDCRRRLDANPLRVLDCKVDRCRAATASAPAATDYLCPECRAHFDTLIRYLGNLGIQFELDPRLVRGLDYYTRTVFEFKHAMGLGTQDTIIGGGRYDGLVEEFGGPPTPAAGFGSGIERTLMVAQALGITPPPEDSPYAFVAAIAEEGVGTALALASKLRAHDIPTEMGQPGRSLKAQMRQANRSGASVAIILGEQELAEDSAAVRNLVTGEQTLLRLADLPAHLAEKLASSRQK